MFGEVRPRPLTAQESITAPIPLGELMQRISELDSSRPIAVICASGSRSQSAAALLGRNGIETIYNVLGGMYAWQDERLPVER